MDFSKMMSAQIAKKQAPASKAAAVTSTDQKYLKRAEIEAAREAAYKAEQEAKERERIERADRKRKLEDDEAERNREREIKRQRLAEESKLRRIEEEQKEEQARRKRLGLPELPSVSADHAAEDETPVPEGEDDLPEEELIIKLREASEPIRLFGESHASRLRRYHKLQEQRSKSLDMATKPKTIIPTSLEPVAEAEMKVPAKAPAVTDAEGRIYLARQLTAWFNLVLKEWAIALASRSEETKQTFTGKAASNSMISAINDLKPLFRRLEKINKDPEKLPPDLLDPIADIVYRAQERQYVKANDGYLQLSIGKAAWPIGVTMVGIHERSAREKLHETDKGKAHIMADEATRKILQSIKRCLTFAQTRWPPEDVGQLMG